MKIVLSILQFLGWSLLAVVGILLVVLLLLLFCRLHYVLEGEWLEEKWARFKAHWLFHLIRAKISYGDDLIYGEIHIFWKKITFSFDLTSKKEEIEDVLEEAEDELEEEIEAGTEETGEELADIDSNTVQDDDKRVEEKVVGTETAAELRGETEPWSEMDAGDRDVDDVDSNDTDADSVDSGDADTNDTDSDDKNTDGEENVESIVSKIKGIIERIKQVYPKIKRILTDKQNQDAVKHLKDEIVYLLKIFIPKKSKIDAIFSTGSPDTTGQLFGVLACFPVMQKGTWKLIPDFQSDDAYFKGTFWGKGWIALYQLVGIVLRIVFDKNCRRLYTMIKKFLKWIKKDEKSQEEK